jgi:putative ubiquitin-RnfH superfamily antitoxin RatB of RatAB toxin-antitoxin module
MARVETIAVEVAYSPRPGEAEVVALQMPAGSTLADALEASGLLPRHGLDVAAVRAGIWSRVREPATPLRERDRVEIYRGLLVDPKEARRQRYQQHREKLAAPKKAP